MHERSFATHDGGFHADDVAACALLLHYNRIDRHAIVRTREPHVYAQCAYVCDVGGIYDPAAGRFDHHQNSYQGTHSSFGLLLLSLKEQGVVSEAYYEWLHRHCGAGIDAVDNGYAESSLSATLSDIVATYVPPEPTADASSLMHAFLEAVQFVEGYFARLHTHFLAYSHTLARVQELMQRCDTYLWFDTPVRWMQPFFAAGGKQHPAQFVVMPTPQGTWRLRTIPPSLDAPFAQRTPLPAAWAGLTGEALEQVCGIEGAIFCHKNAFVSVWKNEAAVRKALQKVLA